MSFCGEELPRDRAHPRSSSLCLGNLSSALRGLLDAEQAPDGQEAETPSQTRRQSSVHRFRRPGAGTPSERRRRAGSRCAGAQDLDRDRLGADGDHGRRAGLGRSAGLGKIAGLGRSRPGREDEEPGRAVARKEAGGGASGRTRRGQVGGAELSTAAQP